MFLQTCQVAFDGVLDIGQSFFSGLAFGDASGQSWALHCVVPVFVLFDDGSILHFVMPTVGFRIVSS